MTSNNKQLVQSILSLALIGTFIAIAYGRTMGNYFLADDFGEIRYVADIYNGDLNKLWSNFTGNYMQIPSMAVYRPWLLMSLVFDYGIWGVKASGYYLTNLLHYFACAALIFFLIRRLTAYWGDIRSIMAALSSALIFAVNPLHCESLSWVVGRVDIVCLAYYLGALLCVTSFVENRKQIWLYGSLLLFSISITTKEMAIGLPVVASCLAFLYAQKPISEDEASQNKSIIQEGIDRFNSAKPVLIAYGAATVVYFLIRYLTLHTFFGGYTGSIGATQLSSILSRWSDIDSFFRVIFPFNYEIMANGGILRQLLCLAYFSCFALILTRFFIGIFPRRLILFTLTWLCTSLVPIYQLYGLGYNLEGMRFLFFATAPLSVLIPALIFAPWQKSTDNKPTTVFESYAFKSKELIISALAVLCIIIVFTRTSYKNNTVWIEAGRQTKVLTEKLRNLAKPLTKQEKIAVLGIPKNRSGAHMILNGQTLSFALAPPFNKNDLSDKVVTFEPILFGRMDLINQHHFKESLANKDISNFYLWDFNERDFVKLDLKNSSTTQVQINVPVLTSHGSTPKEPIILPHSNGEGYINPITLQNNSIEFNNLNSGLCLEIAPLNIIPTDIDYLELQVNLSAHKELQDKEIRVSFQGNSYLNQTRSDKHAYHLPEFAQSKGNDVLFRIPLSSFWQWYSYKYINNIFLELPPLTTISISAARLIKANKISPTIKIINSSPTTYGTYSFTKSPFELEIEPLTDSSNISLEISKPNFFFENFQDNDSNLAISKVIENKPKETRFAIRKEDLGGFSSGLIQLRARCKSEDGNNFGEYSNSVTLEIID